MGRLIHHCRLNLLEDEINLDKHPNTLHGQCHVRMSVHSEHLETAIRKTALGELEHLVLPVVRPCEVPTETPNPYERC